MKVVVETEERGIAADFDTSAYLTPDAATLRAKGNYFISLLRSHIAILDELVENGARLEAGSIRAKEKLGEAHER